MASEAVDPVDPKERLRAERENARRRRLRQLIMFLVHLALFVGCFVALQTWLTTNDDFQRAFNAMTEPNNLLFLARLPLFGWALGVMLHGVSTLVDFRPDRRALDESLVLRQRLASANAELRRTDAEAPQIEEGR